MIRAALPLLILLVAPSAFAQTPGPLIIVAPEPTRAATEEAAAAAKAETDAILVRSEPVRLALFAALDTLRPEADAIARDPALSEDEKHQRITALLDRIPAEIEAVEVLLDEWAAVKARHAGMTPEQTARAMANVRGRVRRSLVHRLEGVLYPSAADAPAAPNP